VRLGALSAIAGASGTPTGPWHGNAGPDGIDRVIITRLTSDTWPEVRRSAAQTLGVRCERPGPAKALFDAVARDPDLAVRSDALAGLVECKAPGTAAVLAKLWDDSEAPLDLRRRAVDLTVQLGDAALAKKLAGKLRQWRGGAIESEAALALAQNAAYALGATAAPGAAEALIAALDDSAYPEIVAAAATGLGLLGPACPPAAKKKLEGLRDSEEQQVQIAAKRAASVCGKR
jgi:HEAT repeat protein